MKYFPLFVSGARLRVLVVGGGVIAAAKLETLAAAGANVKIVALSFGEGVRALADRYSCRLLQQAYEPSLLADCNVVVAAAGDAQLGAQIARDAEAAGIWANIVDDPQRCDFIFPAIVRHGFLQIAISSGGVSPVLARLLKQDIEQILPENLEELLGFIKERTASVREVLPDVPPRRFFWERVIRGPVGRMLSLGQHDEASAWFLQALAHAAHGAAQRKIHLVTISSFDPDDLTVRMVRCIGKADVIFYEGGRGMLPLLDRYARRDAEKYALASVHDPVARGVALAGEGGAIVYLALASNGAWRDVRAQITQAAARAGVSVDSLGMPA